MAKDKAVQKAIKALDTLKQVAPDTEITIETDHGTATCKVGDANIYDDPNGDIIIDAE